MPETLLGILKNFRSNPTLVIDLYPKLFEHTYYTFVQNGSVDTWSSIKYLTYDTADNILELPLFTQEQFIFENIPDDSTLIEISGLAFWQNLLTIVKTGELEAAIDPGQSHGIRLTKEMILSMVVKFGSENAGT